MRRLLREVGRARRAMEQFAAAGERAEAFSVPLEDLPLFNAAGAYGLLTGTPGVDEILTRQMVRAQSASPAVVDATARVRRPAPRGEPAIGRPGHPLAGAGPDRGSRDPVGMQNRGVPSPQVNLVDRLPNSAAMLAQRFDQAGLKAAWERAFHASVEPPPAVASPPTTVDPAPAIAGALRQQLLRTVERAESADRDRAAAPGRRRPASRQIPPAEGHDFVPHRSLTVAEAGKLRAAIGSAPASAGEAASRQSSGPPGVTLNHRSTGAPDSNAEALPHESDRDRYAAPPPRWGPPGGSGLRRLASLAGVVTPDPDRDDPPLAVVSARFPQAEWPHRHDVPATGPDDFVVRLEEALRAEAIRSGIPPEDLIR